MKAPRRLLRPVVYGLIAVAAAIGLSVRRPNLQARDVPGAAALSSQLANAPAIAANDAAVHTLDWRTLAGLDVRTGTPNDVLRQLNGRLVRIPGYIVPLDDFAEAVSEFLLVPYFGACIHTPPPPPNQMVHVRVTGDSHKSANWMQPVWIEGRFAIRAVTSPYGLVAFQLQATAITPYTEP